VGALPEIAWSWAPPWRRARAVRRGRVRQTGPTGQIERASERASVLMSGTHGTTREGKRAWMGLAPTSRPHQTGRYRLSGRAGARAWAGPAGLIWAEKGFSIFLEFPIAFLFYLL
jgi:hypothetical protein